MSYYKNQMDIVLGKPENNHQDFISCKFENNYNGHVNTNWLCLNKISISIIIKELTKLKKQFEKQEELK